MRKGCVVFFSIQDYHTQGEDPIKTMGKGVIILTELQPKPFPPVSNFHCVQLDYIWKLVTEIRYLKLIQIVGLSNPVP